MTDEAGSVTIWLEHARQGDSRAAQRLWDRYMGALIRRARVKLGSLDPLVGSEDVASVAFYRFLRDINSSRFPRLDDREDLWQVLVMLTEERAIDEIRQVNAKKRLPPHKVVREAEIQQDAGNETHCPGLAGVVSREPTPQFAAEAAENLQRWLKLLSNQPRQVAMLKLAGYTNKEIAEQLGVAPRSIERHLALIRHVWGEAKLADGDA